ncbi:transglutaminase [Fictibacillus macauensis ZFHKF-1]|uniref:Transglutaminase n=1 Tax=Fictibacillus macauensis ZFHKF-1 TaxID=1196324 RepID=I8UJX6_9BACL|nr:hypothetical protein [Fictibacillus macauensis]EIT87128.1 transglutaminase [Fictibacillus macauensis ZFHKF-1]
MIYIGGKPFTTAEELPSYAQMSGMQKEIAKKIWQSNETFFYDHNRQFQFEVILRSNTVTAALALKKSGANFATFRTASANKDYWIVTGYGGLLMRSDVNPSDAVADIFNHGSQYGFECTTSMMVILYKAILDTIGVQRFNQLFRGLLLYSTEHDEDLQLTAVTQGESIPGDLRYIANPDFHPSTPQWQGENIIMLTDGQLFGHGVGLGTLPEFIAILNRFRYPGAATSAYLTAQIIRPNFRRMAEYVSHPIRRLLV